MYSYPVEELKSVVSELVSSQLSPETWSWLQAPEALLSVSAFNRHFVLIPRKTGKAAINISRAQLHTIQKIRSKFSVEGYSIDRLCRLWLLLQLGIQDEDQYFGTIDNLFRAAEVNELVLLYGSLPVLAYPEKWALRCAEGIRSNIGLVLETVICDNPYPSEQLSETAWNQLVLKALFTEKDINRIIGIDERANRALADSLIDFARERRSAQREVPPQLWRCVGPFIDSDNFSDLQKAVDSANPQEQKAALLACSFSHYPPAKALLDQHATVSKAVLSGKLRWNVLAREEESIV